MAHPSRAAHAQDIVPQWAIWGLVWWNTTLTTFPATKPMRNKHHKIHGSKSCTSGKLAD